MQSCLIERLREARRTFEKLLVLEKNEIDLSLIRNRNNILEITIQRYNKASLQLTKNLPNFNAMCQLALLTMSPATCVWLYMLMFYQSNPLMTFLDINIIL